LTVNGSFFLDPTFQGKRLESPGNCPVRAAPEVLTAARTAS